MNWNWPRMAVLAFTCLLTPGCEPEGSKRPRFRPIPRHGVTPTCADTAVSTFPGEESARIEPACYPAYHYYFKEEGYFLASTLQPLPVLEKTCGAFRILVLFFDSAVHRDLLRQNPTIPAPIQAQLETDVRTGLVSVFSLYGPEQVFGFLPVRPPVTFTYEVRVRGAEEPDWTPSDEELASFATFDAVVFLGSLPGGAAGSGARRFPMSDPFFRTELPAVLRIDPGYLSPGLFYNELFRRNVPTLLPQYLLGPTAIVEENGIRYERTLVRNPRTGLPLAPESTRFLSHVLNGWHDVDADGITDCNDAEIEARPWNLDADLLPDLLDPDLEEDNGTYFWTRG